MGRGVSWKTKIRYQYVTEPGLLDCELKTTLSAILPYLPVWTG